MASRRAPRRNRLSAREEYVEMKSGTANLVHILKKGAKKDRKRD